MTSKTGIPGGPETKQGKIVRFRSGLVAYVTFGLLLVVAAILSNLA